MSCLYGTSDERKSITSPFTFLPFYFFTFSPFSSFLFNVAVEPCIL